MYNTVKNLEALLITDDAFFDWEPLLHKHFPIGLPSGYTANYWFRFADGELKIFELEADDTPKHTIRFALGGRRRAIIADLFGNLHADNDAEEILRIVTSPIRLNKLGKVQLS